MALSLRGSRSHSVNAAMPACATRLTHERFSAGIARYQGRVCSMRSIAAAVSVPMLRSMLRMVMARRPGMARG